MPERTLEERFFFFFGVRLYRCWVYAEIFASVTFEYFTAVVGCLWFFFTDFALHSYGLTEIDISLSELTGARTFNCWCVVELLGEGKKQKLAFIVYLLTLIEHTVSFGRTSFAEILSMVLRIEDLVMNCPYSWKWSFHNQLGGIRWGKACSVCWADKHWRPGRKLNDRAVTF